MSITLSVRTNAIFDTVEQARLVGQAVERVLGLDLKDEKLGHGPIQLADDHTAVYLHQPTPAVTTRDGQLIDGRIMALTKNLRAAFPELAEQDFLAAVKVLDGQVWVVDYKQLLANIRELVSEVPFAQFQAVVANTLQNEVLRGLK
jgi:hypothetical protein